jgi:biopolymer transport protein ExbB
LINIHTSPEERQRQTQATALLELPLYERRIGTLSAIAKIAPIIGLLGTTLGFLDIFRELKSIGVYSGISALAEHTISCILLTAAGLIIAVFSNLFYHFLHGRSKAQIHTMEWAYNRILQITNTYSCRESSREKTITLYE